MNKTIKSLCALACIALLAACAGPANKLESVTPGGNVIAAATLAFAGSCEMDVAAGYTEVIMARQFAARELRANRITVAQAVAVQNLADNARTSLDAACPHRYAELERKHLVDAQVPLRILAKIREKKQ